MSVFESPLLIAVAGAATAAVIGFFWLQTGRRSLIYLLVLCLILTAGLLALERFIETEREQIKSTLHQVAQLVEQNQLAAALEYVHSSRSDIRSRAEHRLAGLVFERVSIKRNLKIMLTRETEPKRATATFNAVAVLREGTGIIDGRPIPRFVKVEMEKEEGRWRVVDYVDREPIAGFQNKDAQDWLSK